MVVEMTLREHLDELRVRVLRIVIIAIAITIFSMSFGLRPVDYAGFHLAYPYPDPINNISVGITHYMQKSPLPQEVRLIQTAPGQAFFAQLHVALSLGVLGSLPVIVKEISGFVSPAINISKSTKISIWKILIPIVSLFVTGILFSYLFVIPFTLDFLYRYGEAIGVETFLNINDFIDFVMQFFIGFGVAFQLPVIMYAISATGVMSPRFWRHNFRYAIIVLAIFGAAITPDGSGITMWFVSGPMIALYLVGIFFVERRAKRIEMKARRSAGI
jgi:sec-independent protein translocase protein TatC